MKKSISTLCALTLLGCGFFTQAMASDEAIVNQLKKLGVTEVKVQPSPIKGVKSVITNEGIFYTSEDGKYVLHGKMFEITDHGVVDISSKMLMEKLNSYKDEMVVYPAKNEKYVVTVFMDITCHYCHLLHQQIKEYNDLGITVRYLAFPRGGMDNQTAQQMEAIWSAKDKQFALNEAEKGNLPKELKTPNIVKKHYELGVQFGVRGTPSIVLPNGELLGGYLKPQQLLEALKETN